MIEKTKNFFRDDLWNFRLRHEKGWRYFKFKWLRVIYLACKGFYRDNCSLSASSLTYYTLMSIVPVLAMSVAVVRPFGYQDILRQDLFDHFREQNVALEEFFRYADTLIEKTNGGVIAGLGFVLLFWSVSLLLSSMETILNIIWKVKKSRSWKKTVTDYFTLIVIGPFFFIFANSVTVFSVKKLEAAVNVLPITPTLVSYLHFLIHLLPFALFWVLFTFIYLILPNTKVHFRSAILGGWIASCLYVVMQWVYIYFQVGVSRYGAIYGSMAALPLFLVWLQLSWFLVLFGAEISYAHQTRDEHEFEDLASRMSLRFKRALSLWLVHTAIHRFIQKQSPLSKEMIVKKCELPPSLIGPILNELIAAKLLLETKEGYVPARPAEDLLISDVINALETRGLADFSFVESKTLAPFERALEQFRAQIESSPENKPLTHVPYSF